MDHVARVDRALSFVIQEHALFAKHRDEDHVDDDKCEREKTRCAEAEKKAGPASRDPSPTEERPGAEVEDGLGARDRVPTAHALIVVETLLVPTLNDERQEDP